VVDLDRATAPYRLGIATTDTSYVFNASGQVIDVGRLLCLFDDTGRAGGGATREGLVGTAPLTAPG
jgi:hypothetical protein